MGQGYEDHLVTQEADIPEVERVQWRKIDAQLCSVLWQSIDPKILLHLQAYKTCFKFWTQAKGLYTNDIQRLYKVASAIIHISQQDLDLSTYIGHIASLKEEFLTVMPLTPDVGAQQTQLDKFFMVLTLIGLRPDLEPVRDQILGSSSVLSLDDVFACFLRISSTQTLPSDSISDSSVPSLIPAKSLWSYLNPIISLSHSSHQSLFSEPREKTLSDQSNRRQKTLTAGKIFRRTFPANFPATVFFYTARSAWRRSSICPKAPEPETHPRAAHARFSVRRLHLTRRRVRAREPLSGDALPPPGSPDADQPPFLPVCAIQALQVPLLGPCTCLGSVLLPFRSMTKYGMASSQVSSVTSPESGGRSEIPNLGGNDSSPILITGHKLNGHNYLQWSQSVLLFICGKGKDEYLTGEAVMPETTEPGFRKWKIENSMIMSWLINSMNNDIGENFLLFGTAKDIWDAAKETYSSSENTSELFQVESALHDFRQGEQSVTQYYNTLTRYWQQLDLFETHSWKCSDDAATYRQIVEQKRLFKFFLGLNRELDDVRGRIMGIKPLPSLREAFSEVRREESRKKVMMGSKEQPAPTLDASALAARSFNSSGGDRQKRDRPWCDYCKKPGHYKETCWKLHGKPADWKPKPRVDRDGRAHVAANSESTSVPEPSPFNKEQWRCYRNY
ncbi:hypothetical protein CK203_000126 [Vitis vinifera]|uniref:Uncharacterized protein n=1 Tax=Vitis vinifera TaxID=29760 RepID=A0A438KPM9_VITVI|nr:hypothetical protein CK203_000126 [Vitis vinifera]